ncbi:hypothetical protein GCM10022409_46810 [Hymenobacter glaciei]|uniref:Uncharacterized protein n=1 Tax=Hymenobacter glaciei TaxID=877209 RepID=A0ABP7UWR0_9BACT
MRSFILERIKTDTPLAQLFYAYMSGLATLEIFSTPRESMRACRVAFAHEAHSEKPALSIVGQAQRYYELTVLSNALNSLYWHIEQAAELLALTGNLTINGNALTLRSSARSDALATAAGRAATAVQLYTNPAHGGAATPTGAIPGTVVTVFDALGRSVASATAGGFFCGRQDGIGCRQGLRDLMGGNLSGQDAGGAQGRGSRARGKSGPTVSMKGWG